MMLKYEAVNDLSLLLAIRKQ